MEQLEVKYINKKEAKVISEILHKQLENIQISVDESKYDIVRELILKIDNREIGNNLILCFGYD